MIRGWALCFRHGASSQDVIHVALIAELAEERFTLLVRPNAPAP